MCLWDLWGCKFHLSWALGSRDHSSLFPMIPYAFTHSWMYTAWRMFQCVMGNQKTHTTSQDCQSHQKQFHTEDCAREEGVSVQAASKQFCDMFLWHNYIDLRDSHPEPQPFIPQERDLSLYNLFNHLIFIVLLKGLWICHVCNTDAKFGTVVTTSNMFQ